MRSLLVEVSCFLATPYGATLFKLSRRSPTGCDEGFEHPVSLLFNRGAVVMHSGATIEARRDTLGGRIIVEAMRP
jgi:hypothetical protein